MALHRECCFLNYAKSWLIQLLSNIQMKTSVTHEHKLIIILQNQWRKIPFDQRSCEPLAASLADLNKKDLQ